ncbi:hypothetical protein PLESTM_000408800 [Pleodorina starrii]|nr:hypothetical protein PLESTM_000408800 [Pleodorina starrii]
MGSWAAAVAEAEARAAAIGAAPRLGRLHAGLGAHLLCHVRAVGWAATAEWIARQIRRCCGGGEGTAAAATAATAAAAAVLDSPSAAGAAAAAANAHDIGAFSDGICGSEDSLGALSLRALLRLYPLPQPRRRHRLRRRPRPPSRRVA